MKLLRDFVRLRAAGRRLLSVRRDSRNRSYAVTVPQPLRSVTSDLNREPAQAPAGKQVGAKPASAHTLCHVSSR